MSPQIPAARATRRASSPGHMALAFIAMLSPGCNGDSGTTLPAVPAELRVEGSGQAGPVAAPLGEPLVARVLDASGRPVTGVAVEWAPGPGAGTIQAEAAATGSDGTLRAVWTLGTRAGPQAVTVRVAGLPERSLDALAHAGPAAALRVAGGDEQIGTVAGALPIMLAVEVADAHGNLVSGAQVTWTVSAGSGSIEPSASATGANGRAQTRWTLGTRASAGGGEHRVEARTVGVGTAVVFRATARPGPVATIQVQPRTVQFIAIGDSTRATASAIDAWGNAAEASQINWNSEAPGVASVSSGGWIRATGNGTTRIIASEGTVSDAVSAAVQQVAVGFSITPRTETIDALGFTRQLFAGSVDRNGYPLAGVAAAWRSLDPAVATVDAGGLVRAHSTGSARIVAEHGVLADTARMVVRQVPATVAISGATAPLLVLDTLVLHAVVRDAGGALIPGASVTWNSSRPATASVSGGTVIARDSGTASIAATGTAAAGSATGSFTVHVQPTAARLLPDLRAAINPAMLERLDLAKPLWLGWDGNEYLIKFADDPINAYDRNHIGLTPAEHNRLILRPDGWYETQVPVPGALFTAVQIDETTRRISWAAIDRNSSWHGVIRNPPRAECGLPIGDSNAFSLHLPVPGYPKALYDSWIRKTRDGDATVLFLSRHLLPVDAGQLDPDSTWVLVGDRVGWDRSTAIRPTAWTAEGLTFRISGARNAGVVNVRATTRPFRTASGATGRIEAWGRFGYLATGELDGYFHPEIQLDCREVPLYGTVGIRLP